eukprot:CAMPEP_0173183060 /NCGR_PEP_ID=MMETSP1141-20130122/8187_1 /TAXON_ID=483371 /ORGANISM="non described non described, Strain CCMP2298" /LENGTH=147 /DNA_ID=CAMNT_0014106231 /DNA_START=351 /DNA_END=795 /DNA_ORIENTATION=-
MEGWEVGWDVGCVGSDEGWDEGCMGLDVGWDVGCVGWDEGWDEGCMGLDVGWDVGDEGWDEGWDEGESVLKSDSITWQPQHRICRRGLHTPRYYHVIFAVAVHVSCAADGHAEVVILRGSPNDEEAAGNEARQYHGREPARLFKDDV